jgi:hypothetical protein
MQSQVDMKILVVYNGFTRRPSLLEGVLCFERYSNAEVYYWNARLPGIPAHVRQNHYDLIFFSTMFFSRRSQKETFIADLKRAMFLKEHHAVKVVAPQDDFLCNMYVNEFINNIGTSILLTVLPENVWGIAYKDVNLQRTKVIRILTGYLDDKRVNALRLSERDPPTRITDIGYRSLGSPYWYGRHGLLKIKVAEVFSKKCADYGLKCDISTEQGQTITSDKWYEFLARCRFVIGVEGGTSIIDWDGDIKSKTEQYLAINPTATFEEVELHCFKGKDGEYPGYAISPRHLEACLTRTCQILVEGEYSGILKPNVHYLPVKKDFSDIDTVLDKLSDESLRQQITERAFRDIVMSGYYLYSCFVRKVLSEISSTNSSLETPRYQHRVNAFEIKMHRPANPLTAAVEHFRSIRNIFIRFEKQFKR